MTHNKNLSSLVESAARVRQMAYVPYSGFAVGCAILSSQGSVYTGCNVENISYPEGICAETNAIGSMVADGETLISYIVILGGPKDKEPIFCPPCGGCRQRIHEFANANTEIFYTGTSNALVSAKVSELLPVSFSQLDNI